MTMAISASLYIARSLGRGRFRNEQSKYLADCTNAVVTASVHTFDWEGP